MKYLLTLIILLGILGCEPQKQDYKAKPLTTVTVKEVTMGNRDGGNQNILVYIVQDGTDSKTARIVKDIKYVPIVGDQVKVANWDGNVFGDVMIVDVVKTPKAEIDIP